MNVELVIGAGVVCAAILAIGVQIFFYTNTFKQEYEDSVRRLIAESSNKLQEEIGKLEHLGTGGIVLSLSKDEMGSNLSEEDFFPELGYDLEEGVLAKIREISVDVEFWLKAIEDGKRILRWMSISLVLLASVLFVIVFTISLYNISYAVLVAEYIGGPCLLGVIYNINRYLKLVRILDKENIRLKRSET